MVWCGCGLLPSPPCGVVWYGCGLFPPPCGVVWFGCGLWWSPPFPSCGVVWVGWFPPACLDLLGGFGKPMRMMILMMMMMMTIIMIIIITIILVVLWLVVGYLLPTCLLTIMALLSLWANCNRVAMSQLSQGSGLSGNTVRVTAALFVGVLFRKCLQSHGTRSS